jgi:hypothetical protein
MLEIIVLLKNWERGITPLRKGIPIWACCGWRAGGRCPFGVRIVSRGFFETYSLNIELMKYFKHQKIKNNPLSNPWSR